MGPLHTRLTKHSLWVSTQRKAAAVVVLACKTDVHKLQMAGLRDHNGARAQAPVCRHAWVEAWMGANVHACEHAGVACTV
eukprot:1159694-Pelagomonas_calceolata.AAC.2